MDKENTAPNPPDLLADVSPLEAVAGNGKFSEAEERSYLRQDGVKPSLLNEADRAAIDERLLSNPSALANLPVNYYEHEGLIEELLQGKKPETANSNIETPTVTYDGDADDIPNRADKTPTLETPVGPSSASGDAARGLAQSWVERVTGSNTNENIPGQSTTQVA